MSAAHLYVHVPFCARRCAYCDFAIAVRSRVPVDEYVSGVEREIRIRFGDAEPWQLDTLYFGGGTPSRLGGEGVARLVSTIREHAVLAVDAEVTLEANPEDVTAESVDDWIRAGINRLSLGAQSFDDDVLRWMHRTHDASRVHQAMRQARLGGLTNISLDLIFALPPEIRRDWSDDLARVLDLAPSHVSLYGLTVEPRTPLGRWTARGVVSPAEDERYEAEFLEAHERLTSAGFRHYEVSNFAGTGGPSRHNSSYWTGESYVALGPGAHEFDGSTRRWNAGAYTEWLGELSAGRDPVQGSEALTPSNRVAEQVYLGLRADAGLELRGNEVGRISRWIAAGWATLHEMRLRLTPTGWLRLDALAADLTSLRSPS